MNRILQARWRPLLIVFLRPVYRSCAPGGIFFLNSINSTCDFREHMEEYINYLFLLLEIRWFTPKHDTDAI